MDLKNRVTFESDPYWPDRYEEERMTVLEASGEKLLGVFHVGSTAIREVPGKPALDVIAVYENEQAMHTAGDALTEHEAYEREHVDTVVVRWAKEYAVFIKLHTQDDEKVRNQLAFREFLRENPEARREYTSVKRKAAEEHPEDLEGYTKAKTDVVNSILDQARNEGYYEDLPDFV